ncbi:MAG: hypothetical protein ACM3TU_00255 [Bacillota bacterium]
MAQVAQAQVITIGTFAFRRETYERLAIGATTLVLLAVLPARYFFLSFVMLGQGHFLMTYLYQWKGGKIGWRYLALYVPALLLLGYLATYVIPLPALLLVTGSVFALHFFYDEARLYARDNSISLGVVWYPALLFFLVLVKLVYGIDVFPAIIIGTLLFILQTARQEGKPEPHSSTHRYMLVFATFLLVLLLAPAFMSPTAVLGAIILYHYMSWYVHYFFRLRDAGRPLRPYLVNGVTVNVVVIALFIGFMVLSGPGQNALGLIFGEQYFYVWTLLHILFASNEFMTALRAQVFARAQMA